MSRSDRLGMSSTGSHKQLAVKVNSAHAKTNKANGKVVKKTVADKPRRSPARSLPRSVLDAQKSGFPRGAVWNTDGCSPKESINVETPRDEEQAQRTAVLDELKMKHLRKAQRADSARTGGTTHAPPAVEPLPTHETKGEEEQSEEEDAEDEDIKAPVELKMEFLRAVMDRDFQLAVKMCQMILIYEPDNPEASEFLPLIREKLLEEQEAERSAEEEDDEGDDGSEDSGSDEESSQSSSCSSSSCSSSSPSDDDEEKPMNRHKPCPPSHISP